MGHWGVSAWDNDYAADWFGRMFKDTGLAKYVRDALQGESEEFRELPEFAKAIDEDIRNLKALL